MKTNILIMLLVFFLTIGVVTAIEIDDFKVPTGFGNLNNGIALDTSDSDTYLYVEKITDNSYFESDPNDGYAVSKLDDEMYVFVDTVTKEAGVQEKVEVDGDYYLVSVSKANWENSANNPEDVDKMQSFRLALEEFNSDNNLKPIVV